MDWAAIGGVAGIIAAIAAIAGVGWTIRSSVRAGVVEDEQALKQKYEDGIAEGLRRAQSTIDRLTGSLELRTSERDQARSELAAYMMQSNNQRPRREGGQ